MSYPRLSTLERRKLATSARATRAGRNAALRVGVMGGAGAGQGPSNPSSAYYGISEGDRQVIERVIQENNDPDTIKAERALESWSSALFRAAPHLPAVMSGAAYAGAFVLDFFGKRVYQPFTLPSGSASCNTGGVSSVMTSLEVSLPFTHTDGSTVVQTTIKGAYNYYSWNCGTTIYDVNEQKWRKRYNSSTTVYEPKPIGSDPFPMSATAISGPPSTWDAVASGPDDIACEHPRNREPMSYSEQNPLWSGVDTQTGLLRHVDGRCYTVRYTCNGQTLISSIQVCPGFSTTFPQPILNSPYGVDETRDPAEPVGPEDAKLTKEEITELVRILCEEHGYCPEDPCEPTGPGGGGPGGGPGGYDPPGWDPPGDGGGPGGGPGGYDPGGPPGYDPGEGPEPGDYADPGPGEGEGVFDPGRETCVTFRDPPSGFNDPTQPGGVARRYQPGQRATVRSGGTPREADAVDRAETTTICWDALRAAPWNARATDSAERLYPPYDFIRRKNASDGLWNCLILLGWQPREADEDVQVVAERALYRPGAPDVYTGKIKRVKRLENGGVRICFHSPLEDKPAPEKICFRGKVQDAIAGVLSQMGVENVIFDSDCNEVIFPRVCFPAGTPLRHILNYLLDLCGFCAFPQFDGAVIVGHCEPLNVHWHYHEDVDLIGFDLEYDNTEIPAIVEVYRPDRINRAGRVTSPGYAYPYPVQSPFGSGEDVLRIEVPPGTTNAHVRSIAHSKARGLSRKAMPLTSFAVPLNSGMGLRHQIHIHRPSLGFTGVYMVTRLAREYTDEAFLNLGMGRWLRGDGAASG